MNDALNPASVFQRAANKDSPEGEYADKILRGEMSAVEAYDKILSRFEREQFSQPTDHLTLLREIRDDHDASCLQVRQIVREEGAEPSEDSGPWGALVTTMIDAVSLFGENGALRMLKSGEEHGLRQYHELLQLNLIPHEKKIIRDVLIPKQERHLLQLDSMLATSTQH